MYVFFNPPTVFTGLSTTIRFIHLTIWFEAEISETDGVSQISISVCVSLFCDKCAFNIDLCAYSTQQHLCHQYTLSCRVELFIEFIFHCNCFNNCTRERTIGKCLDILLYSDEQRAVNGYWKSLQMRTFSAAYCVFQNMRN